MTKGIITIAVGSPTYGRMAANLALSVKKSGIPISVIYTKSAFKDIEWALELFDMKISIMEYSNPSKMAMDLKLGFFFLTPYDKTLFLDADTILSPSKDISKLFDELDGIYFTAQCYAINKLGDKPSPKYEHWMDYKDILGLFKPLTLDTHIPQINSSFIYFDAHKSREVMIKARGIYYKLNESGINYKKWRGQIPDELCFNIACAIECVMPHKSSFRPLYVGGSDSKEWITNHYYGVSLIGANPNPHLISIYNDLSRYYCQLNGIAQSLEYKPKNAVKRTENPMLPHTKKVLASIGGLGELSMGGIINPSAWKEGDNYKMILRVDENLEGYKGRKEKARCRPFLAEYDDRFNLISLVQLEGDDKRLIEDWRVYYSDQDYLHGGCAIWDGEKWKQGHFEVNRLFNSWSPFKEYSSDKNQKNWGFFDVGRCWEYYVYSVEPFVVRDSDTRMVATHDFNSGWDADGFISCSTYPQKYGNDYLMWVHKKQKDLTYLNSVMIFDGETFEPKYFIPHHVLGSEGIDQPLYISSCLVEDDRILIFGGEGGIPEMSNAALKHSTVRIIDRTIFDNLIKQYPCQPNKNS